MTAADVVDRIKKNIGVPWRDATFRDTYKAGGPDTRVTGIATTMFNSFEVVERAVAAGLNMILPHETTFWNDRDDVAIVSADALYREKRDYLSAHDIVIFRMHDHVHDRRPDFTYVGSARLLGLDPSREAPAGSHHFTIPDTTLGALATDVRRRTGIKTLRVVGDPNARVRRIQIGVGYATPSPNAPDVDVIISGEQQELDGVLDAPEYVLDAAALGIAKGWIMLGHNVSEEDGMLDMAAWIRSFVPEVPVQFVKSGEPFWTPD